MSESLLVSKTDFKALYLSETYCHMTGTRPPSCNTPREPTIYILLLFGMVIFGSDSKARAFYINPMNIHIIY